MVLKYTSVMPNWVRLMETSLMPQGPFSILQVNSWFRVSIKKHCIFISSTLTECYCQAGLQRTELPTVRGRIGDEKCALSVNDRSQHWLIFSDDYNDQIAIRRKGTNHCGKKRAAPGSSPGPRQQRLVPAHAGRFTSRENHAAKIAHVRVSSAPCRSAACPGCTTSSAPRRRMSRTAHRPR